MSGVPPAIEPESADGVEVDVDSVRRPQALIVITETTMIAMVPVTAVAGPRLAAGPRSLTSTSPAVRPAVTCLPRWPSPTLRRRTAGTSRPRAPDRTPGTARPRPRPA